MNKIDILKGVASMITGAGVGKTVDLIIKNNLPVEMNWKMRMATMIGSAAIGGLISAKCGDYVEGEIDKVVEIVEGVKKVIPDNHEVVIDNRDDISVEMTD